MRHEDAAYGMHQLAIGAFERERHLRHHPQRDKQSDQHQKGYDEEHPSPPQPVAHIAADGTGRDDACYEPRCHVAHVPGLVLWSGIERGHRDEQLRHDRREA